MGERCVLCDLLLDGPALYIGPSHDYPVHDGECLEELRRFKKIQRILTEAFEDDSE